jgi:hypothetical protein
MTAITVKLEHPMKKRVPLLRGLFADANLADGNPLVPSIVGNTNPGLGLRPPRRSR